MRKLILSLGALSMVVACSSPSAKQSADTVAKTDTSIQSSKTTKDDSSIALMHFIHTDRKDTTSVQLSIKGDKLTGTMNWMPYEKDARKGKLEGKMHGDTARVTWSFMQEGMNDTLNLNFLLQKNQLSQKPLKLNKQTGRQQTDESAGYGLKYQTVEVMKK